MLDEKNFPFVYPPLAHQMEEFVKHRNTPARGLLWDPGTGKSKSCIDKMAYLFMEGRIDTVVVMAKKGEYTNWKNVEIPEHMPPQVGYDCAIYRSGMKEWEKQLVRNIVKPSGKLRILNINIESITHEGGQVLKAFIKSKQKGLMFVLDESTAAKSHKSKRAKEVYAMAAHAHYRMIMTGTFATHGPLDVWGQSLVLGKGILGTTSFYSFKGEYCIEEQKYFGQRSFKQITGYQRLDKLNKIIKTFASIKTREECFDLPPKIYKKVEVEMTDEQQQMYNDMRDMALAEFGDNVVVEATTALEVMSKLDQIACGQLKLEDGTYRILNNNRIDYLLSRLEDSATKGIIWCNYRGLLSHTFEQIRLNWGVESVGRFHGGVKDDEREDTIAKFQDPESPLRWIVANQQSLGYGRTLIIGKENHYTSNSYNLEHRLQSEDRTMRLGQTDSVLYYDYYCKGTVNEKIYANLRAKKNVMAEILGTTMGSWI